MRVVLRLTPTADGEVAFLTDPVRSRSYASMPRPARANGWPAAEPRPAFPASPAT